MKPCMVYVPTYICMLISLYVMQLSTTADEAGSFLQVMEHFTNLGPIIDMSVVDLDKQGQDLVRKKS